MNTEKASKKGGSDAQLVMLSGAFKLAEKWVNGMSGSLDDSKSTDAGLGGRPARLGIGAAVPRESKIVNFNDPVERKLRAKLDAEKRRVLKSVEESAPSTRDASVDEDSDEEQESKAKAFTKKRSVNLNLSLQAKKKKK